MPDNPYSPPQADLSGGPSQRKRGSRLKAVIVGCAVDFFGTYLFGIAASIAFGIALAVGGMSGADIGITLSRSTIFQIFSFASGMAFTVLGGFVAARIANYLEFRTALWVGFIGLVIGEFILGMSPGPGYPLWSRLLGDLLIMPAALFGANLKVKRYGKG